MSFVWDRGEGKVIQLAKPWHQSFCCSLSCPVSGAKQPCSDLCKFLQKPAASVCVCLFVLESRRGQRKIAARQFPFSKMEVSLALHSIQCGSRGYPASPMITREIKSLPHQLFDSGRKRKPLLPRVCSLRRPPRLAMPGWNCPSPSVFSISSRQIRSASRSSADGKSVLLCGRGTVPCHSSRGEGWVAKGLSLNKLGSVHEWRMPVPLKMTSVS